MRFSEFMLKGCESTHKIIGQLDNDDEGNKGACALGAALIGMEYTGKKYMQELAEVYSHFPALKVKTFCPESENDKCSRHFSQQVNLVQDIIWHLNDRHRMSREAIAMWLGTIEDDLDELDRLETIRVKEQKKEIVNV